MTAGAASREENRTSRLACRALPLALLLVAILPYLPGLQNEFVWDDRLLIAGNPRLASLSSALEYFRRPEGSYYRPVLFLTHAAELGLFGARPFFFHLTNVLLHALASGLLYAAARRTGLGRETAFIGAAIFAVHPLQSEAVAYVSGRTDLLMAAAALLAFLAAYPPRDRRVAVPVRGVLAGLAAAAAILSKETGYALALLLPWLAWRHWRRWSERLAIAGPTVAIAALLLALRPAPLPRADTDLWQALVHVGTTTTEYATLLLWPGALQVDRLVPLSGGAVAGFGALVGMSLIVAVVIGVKRDGPVADWVAWAAAFYLPAANALPIYPAIAERALFAPEHNLYAPLAGIGVLTAMAMNRLRRRLTVVPGPAWVAVAGLILCAWCGRTWARTREWRDEATLFRSAAALGSRSPRVWYNFGNAMMQARRPGDAAAAYRQASRLAPSDGDVWMNLGVALQMQGAFDEALSAYEQSAALRPSPQLYRNLATLQHARGDHQAAQRALERADDVAPSGAGPPYP